MSRFISTTVSFLLNSNIFIASAALMMTLQTQVEFGMYPQFKPYLMLVFFATLFEYNLHRVNILVFHPESLIKNKYKWLNENLVPFYIITFGSAIGFLIFVFQAKKIVLISLLPLAILTFCYSVPFFKMKGDYKRLRDLPFAKIFIIALVWSCITFILPYIESEIRLSVLQILVILSTRFLFILALTIPFDIRDIETDRQYGLKTLAHITGERQGYFISCISVVLMILISSIHYYSIGHKEMLAAHAAGGIFTLFILLYKPLRRLEYYHYGILDGAIIINAILIIGAKLLF